MNDASGLTLPQIEAFLEASGLPYEIWACDDSLADTAAFCAHYRVPPENSVNAILVRSKTALEDMALCMVPAILAGVFSGRAVFDHIPQRVFLIVVLLLSAAGGLRLLL